MKTTLSLGALAAALMLSACVGTPAENAARRDAIKTIAIERIETFNAAGIDPLKLDGIALLSLQSACAMIPSLTTVIRPDAVEAPATALAACEVLMKVAPEADAPVPAVKPLG